MQKLQEAKKVKKGHVGAMLWAVSSWRSSWLSGETGRRPWDVGPMANLPGIAMGWCFWVYWQIIGKLLANYWDSHGVVYWIAMVYET